MVTDSGKPKLSLNESKMRVSSQKIEQFGSMILLYFNINEHNILIVAISCYRVHTNMEAKQAKQSKHSHENKGNLELKGLENLKYTNQMKRRKLMNSFLRSFTFCI